MLAVREAYERGEVEIVLEVPEMEPIGGVIVKWEDRYYVADILSDEEEADVEARYGGYIDFVRRRAEAGDAPDAVVEQFAALVALNAKAKKPDRTH